MDRLKKLKSLILGFCFLLIIYLSMLQFGASLVKQRTDFSQSDETDWSLALSLPPHWSKLGYFNASITESEFRNLLNLETLADSIWGKWLAFELDSIELVKQTKHPSKLFKLALRPKLSSPVSTEPYRFWKTSRELSKSPLSSLKIVIDPAHIGGNWSFLETGSFGSGEQLSSEGFQNLRFANYLKSSLENLGIKVFLTRTTNQATTTFHPPHFHWQTKEEFHPYQLLKRKEIKWARKQAFVSIFEKQFRSQLVNQSLKPDLVIRVHAAFHLSKINHLNWMINSNSLHLQSSNFQEQDWKYDDLRFSWLLKVLADSVREEKNIVRSLQASLQAVVDYPQRGNKLYQSDRSLLLYQCPAISITLPQDTPAVVDENYNLPRQNLAKKIANSIKTYYTSHK